MQNTNSTKTDKKRIAFDLVFTGLLLALCLVISLRLLPFAEDDAYIHFRIAQNFARYFQPFFNPGDPVMSTSSFVWTSILALISQVKLPLPVTVAFLNPLFTVLGAVTWSRLLVRYAGKRSCSLLVMVFELGYVGLMLLSSTGLMESPFALLLLGLVVLLLSRQNRWGWTLLALAIFTRYEMAVYAGLFGLVWLFTRRPWKQKITEILYFLVPTVLLSAVTFGFYGTLIPNTVAAKQVVYRIATKTTFERVFFALFPKNTSPFLGIITAWQGLQEKVFTGLAKAWQPIMIAFSAVVLLIYPKKHEWNRRDLYGLLLVAGGVLLAGLYVHKKVLIFEWYTPIFTIPVFFSVFYFLSRLHESSEGKSCRMKWQQAIVSLFAVLISLNPFANLGLNTYAALVDRSKSPQAATGMRVQRYLEVGKLLHELYPTARLMTSEIGGLGYAFGGEIVDGAGLITPAALEYHPMQVPEQRRNGRIGAIPAAFVYQQLPELVVSYEVFVQEFDASDYQTAYTRIAIPAFSTYWQQQTGLEKVYMSDELYIYIRNDIANEDAIQAITASLNQ